MLDPTSYITSESDVAAYLQPVILGGDIMSYTWVRVFHETYGLDSIVYSGSDAKAISRSKFTDYRIVEGMDQDEIGFAELSRLGPELIAAGKVPLVLGTGDWYTRILTRHKDELSEWFVVPYVDDEMVDRITPKDRFYALCEELDIPYPKLQTFDCSDPDLKIPADGFTYPLIAKAADSSRYHYAKIPNQKKVFTIETSEELTELFTNLQNSSYDRDLIVQDRVPGPDDGLRTITCFCDASGDVRVWSTGRVLLEDHVPTAIGNPVCILIEQIDELAEQAGRLLKHVGYHGFANFDAKYDPRDGKFRFFEVNARPGRNTYYMQLGGANIARLVVQEFVLGTEVPKQVACNEGLFTVVPRSVVRRYVADEDARECALSLYDEGKAKDPMFYHADSLAHGFWARIQYYNQIRKFKRYLGDMPVPDGQA